MKNTLLLLIAIMLGFASCEPINEPEARFDVSNTVVFTYEDIYFYNSSRFANEYEWSFGDGNYTNTFEPVHYYTQPGTYKVILSAFNHDMVSETYTYIDVVEPASFNILVKEYTDNYILPGAKVILYPTLDDWNARSNAVVQGITNGNGIVVFNDLFPGYYYMDISESHHDNYLLAKDDVANIITPKAISGTTTYFTAYVDYYTTKSAIVNRKIVPGTSKTKRTISPEKTLRTLDSK